MSEFEFSLPSFAKINLHLRVIGRRLDAYHEIFTIFQTVSLQDTLYFGPGDKLEMTCSDPTIPCDNRNLIIRAAQKLKAYAAQMPAGFNRKSSADVGLGAQIHLKKCIPSPGGLGGGSSNAAIAIIGLAKLWNLDITLDQMVEIGSEIGADVPFFFTGGTAIGTGRGTEIENVADFHARNILIVSPDVAVSTAEGFNALNAANLTSEEANRILGVCRSEAESTDSYLKMARNDFESTVYAAYPDVGKVKQRLFDLGASFALLSGSGASVFGIFDTKETRQTAIKALDNEVNWRKFAVATISRNDYREALETAF